MQKILYYEQIKSFFRSLLEDDNNPLKHYFDMFMIGLIILSTALLILETSSSVPRMLMDFDVYIVSYIFALEYLLRLWIYESDIYHSSSSLWFKSKLRYIFSLPALIDFIAIFPQFRILRLLKLYHYVQGTPALIDALLKKRFEFIFLAYMLLGVTFSLGSVFYLLEFGVNPALKSYLDAIYWALVTISSVGYGDIVPVTTLGKLVAILGIIFGVSMIAFMTSVMVAAFSERFNELRNQDSINNISKLKNVVILNGYGHLAETIIKKLKIRGFYHPVIIESDKEKVKIAIENGYQVIQADGSSVRIIKILYHGRNNIVALLPLNNSDIENIYFILNAKSVYAPCVIYTRINNRALEAQYRGTRVDGMVEPYSVVDEKAFNYLQKHANESRKSLFFFGYTQKSRYICLSLKKEGIESTIYEIDTLRYEEAKKNGFTNTVMIDQNQSDTPQIHEGIVVCAMNEEALNVYYAITLRANGFTDEIVTLSDTKEDNRKLLLAGVNKIFDMYEESASQFVEMIENNSKEER